MNTQTSIKKHLIIIGAGGHGQSVMDLAELTENYSQISFIDDGRSVGELVLGRPVIGAVDEIYTGKLDFDEAFVAIGNNQTRKKVLESLLASGFKVTTLVHPRAIVSQYAQLDTGVAVMAGAFVGSNAIVKKGAIINANATIDHDCLLGDFAHIGVGVQLAGGVKVGAMSWLQAGCSCGYFVELESGVVLSPGTVLGD